MLRISTWFSFLLYIHYTRLIEDSWLPEKIILNLLSWNFNEWGVQRFVEIIDKWDVIVTSDLINKITGIYIYIFLYMSSCRKWFWGYSQERKLQKCLARGLQQVASNKSEWKVALATQILAMPMKAFTPLSIFFAPIYHHCEETCVAVCSFFSSTQDIGWSRAVQGRFSQNWIS